MCLRTTDEKRADFSGWIEYRPCFLFGDQFDRTDQSDAHCFANQRMIREAVQPLEKRRACLFHAADEVYLLVYFQGFDSDGGGARGGSPSPSREARRAPGSRRRSSARWDRC